MHRMALLTLLLLAPAGCSRWAGAAAEIWVDPAATTVLENGSRPSPFHSLAAALGRAGAGATIHVGEGTYRVNLSLNRGVRLTGDDERKAVLRAADPERPVITVSGGGVELDGLEIGGGLNGVWVAPHGAVRVHNCLVAGNRRSGLAVSNGHGLWGRAESRVSRSSITGNGVGVTVAGGGAVRLDQTALERNALAGVDARADARLTLMASRVAANGGPGVRIELGNASTATISHSDFRDNAGDAIQVRGTARGWLAANAIAIESNSLAGNRGHGVACEPAAPAGVRLAGNEFAGNRAGPTVGVPAQ